MSFFFSEQMFVCFLFKKEVKSVLRQSPELVQEVATFDSLHEETPDSR